MPARTVADLAQAIHGSVEGDEQRVIAKANTLEAAASDEISFVANDKAHRPAASSQAGCLVVAHSFPLAGPWSLIRVANNPRSAFAKLLPLLYPPLPAEGIHPTAVIAPSAVLAPGCSIGAYTVVGEHVTIGSNTTLHSHVTLYPGVTLGARVMVHSGTVIGADGFGFVFENQHYEKFPQVGTVLIENDVEIGAHCCIDRAALGVTTIGAGSKLDNLVHIAHNCRIGKHVVIAAQTGLAGGVSIGDFAVVGGQVGMGEKAKIAARAVIGSGAGILSFQQVKAGEPVWGTPARPLKQHLKGLAQINKLADLRRQLHDLRDRLAAIEEDKP